MNKLNLCCGNNKIKDCLNVDGEESCKPDMVFNVTQRFPLEDQQFEEVYLFHAIEHVEKRLWNYVLQEIRRVLKPGGFLLISYPEFAKIVEYWLENKHGKRPFWENTIYGLQRYPGDYHVSVVHSPDLKQALEEIGFDAITFKPEPGQDFNTVMKAFKGIPAINYEELLYNSIWKNE